MEGLHHSDALWFLIQISVMLITARLLGEAAKRLGQPSVIGEMLGGVLLGPSILGMVWPDAFQQLFISHPNASIATSGIAQVGVVLLLFIAGLEVDLASAYREGKRAFWISTLGLVVPFLFGVVYGVMFFDRLGVPDDKRLGFLLFVGTVISITALSVASKILMDLKLIRTRIGSIILASAMINDLLGWLLFSIILTLIGPEEGFQQVAVTMVVALVFTMVVLTLVRFLINRGLPVINSKFSHPGGAFTFSMVLCFLGAVATEYIGIHAVFGAFLMGIAFGDSVHFTEQTREVLHQFITNLFAPFFFVSLSLNVDFIAAFDLELTLYLIAFGFVAKLIGSGLGSWFSGMDRKEALAIGFGMNARGAMEVILGSLALEAGLIPETLFVAVIVMAIVTSVTIGPLMSWALKGHRQYRPRAT